MLFRSALHGSHEITDLAGFGYTQELDRNIGTYASFAAGFSFVSILTTVFQLFAFGFSFGGPAFFWKIVLPAAAPYIFTGLKIGIGLSWLAIIAAEMLIGGVGIGFFIWDAWNSSNLSDIIVALTYVGLVGFALDRIVALAGRFATRGTSAS